MVQRRRLGKGLSALIPQADNDKTDILDSRSEKKEANKRASGRKKVENKPDKTEIEIKTNSLQYIPIDEMEADPDQPRKDFNNESLDDLRESIKKYGVLQPLLLKKYTKPGHPPYRIIAGERRYRAAIKAGLKSLPAIVREEKEGESALLSVVENVQREDLNPIEEAAAYRQIMSERSITQKELAEALGKSRPYIGNILRLLNLDQASLEAVKAGLLTSSQARSLLAEKDLKKRSAYRKLLIEGKSNVRSVEKKTGGKRRDPYLEELEENISKDLGTAVNIIPRRKGWSLQIACYSREDLERLIDELTSLSQNRE